MRSNKIQYIRFENALTLTMIFAITGYVTQFLYLSLFTVYLSSLRLIEYTYLLLLVPVAIALIIDIIVKHYAPSGISLDRILVFAVIYTASIIFYVISIYYDENMLQYGMISFVLFLWSLLVLIYKLKELKHYLFLVFLFLSLIPIPLTTISYMYASLSHVMGQLSTYITGSKLLIKGSRFFVSDIDISGAERLFEIDYSCNGLISIMSMLAIILVIAYLVMESRTSSIRKVAVFFLATTVGLAIVFLGDLLKLVIAILIARYQDYELALDVLYQLPSLIFVALAIIAVFYVIRRYLFTKTLSPEVIYDRNKNNNGAGIRLGWALAVFFMIFVAQGFIWVNTHLSEELLAQQMVTLPSIQVIEKNPAIVILDNIDPNKPRNIPIPVLSYISEPNNVKTISMKNNDKTYMGYIEVSESPENFHNWYLCLVLQEYKILMSWSITGNTKINYILVEKYDKELLLGYSIYKITYDNNTATYTRVSLLAPVDKIDYEETMLQIKYFLESITKHAVQFNETSGIGLFEKIIFLENILILVNITMFILIICGTYLKKIPARLKLR